MPVIATGTSDYGAVTAFNATLLAMSDMFAFSGGDFGVYHLIHAIQSADAILATGVAYS